MTEEFTTIICSYSFDIHNKLVLNHVQEIRQNIHILTFKVH